MRKGVALLISVIILGAIFTTFVMVSVQGVVRETSVLQTLAHKKTADARASACLEVALYRFASDANYTGNETIPLDGFACTIRPVLAVGATWVIETEAVAGGRVSRLRATVSVRSPVAIDSVEAVPTF